MTMKPEDESSQGGIGVGEYFYARKSEERPTTDVLKQRFGKNAFIKNKNLKES